MAGTDVMVGMLGKHPPKIDVRTLRMARYMDTTELPPAPPSLDLTTTVKEFPMYANDTVGDCTCAAAGHMIEIWTSETAHPDVPTTEQILTAFDKVKIVGPDGEAGANELDVLNMWQSSGIAGDTLAAFGALTRTDHTLMQQAVNLFAGSYIGLSLPLSAQHQEVWDFNGSYAGENKPGSWGGHAVNVAGYDAATVTFITWGMVKQMTWRFWDAYCDEAYALLSMGWFDGTMKAPNGLDIATLRKDLQVATGG